MTAYGVITQRYDVTFEDGSHREACCGPRVLQLFEQGAIAYTPVGDVVAEACCHYKHPNPALDELNKVELRRVHDSLATLETQAPPALVRRRV